MQFLSFVREQYAQMKVPTTPFNGRTVIVTGSNTGLGLEASIHLARLSPSLIILAVRNTSSGQRAKQTIMSSVPEYMGSIEVWELDLSSFDSVKTFAKRAERELKRLDALLENAGVVNINWTETVDKYEQGLQVNVISTGLLAALLLPLLKKTATLPAPDPKSVGFKPHLTIVGSEVHKYAKLPEETSPDSILLALNTKPSTTFDFDERYNVTKLFNIYLVHRFASLAGEGVVVNVVNPGLCHSGLAREAKGLMFVVMTLMKAVLARTTEQGALNLAWAATEDTSEVKGAYVSACAISHPAASVTTDEGRKMEQRVWDEMVQKWVEIAPVTRDVLLL